MNWTDLDGRADGEHWMRNCDGSTTMTRQSSAWRRTGDGACAPLLLLALLLLALPLLALPGAASAFTILASDMGTDLSFNLPDTPSSGSPPPGVTEVDWSVDAAGVGGVQVRQLFVFPEELSALREPMANYLTTIFAGSRFEEPLMLRGYYFTSGIQQGRPFALACKELLRVHAGDPEGVLENLEQVFAKSRAFFIRDFYEKKVFPEQGLVAKTRETLQKEKFRRRLLIGGAGLTAVILIPLLILAFTSLRSTVGAITENVGRAEECLNENDPCSAKQAYDLIRALENNKVDLQRKWLARWMFLKGRNNPVVVRYIPAAQAALLNERIIGPLQASFDTRAGKVDWTESPELYLTFREAFIQVLRFKELSNPMTEETHREKLRGELRIEPLLAFCSKTAASDDSEDGKIIDDWLLTDVNAPATADQMFTAVVRQFPKVADDNPPLSDRGAREAMLRFWTVDSLAGWDYRLLRVHFDDGFLGFFGRVEGLNVAHAPDRAATVEDFVGLIDQFDNSWRDAVDLMGSGRPATGSTEVSPGISPDQWRAHCLEDFNRVLEVSETRTSHRIP